MFWSTSGVERCRHRIAASILALLLHAFDLSGQLSPSSAPGIAGLAMWKEAVYISDLGTNTVLVQESAADNFRPFIQDQRISAPRGLAVDATFLYIADPVAHQIFAVNRETKEITRLLPDKTALVPIDVQLLPSFVRAQNKLERTITLAALDEASKTVSFITPFSPPDPASTSTDFPGPVSLS